MDYTNKFHTLISSDISLPDKFTNPFRYTPHPLCIEAANQLQAYLKTWEEAQLELSKGKMFGVLVVATPEGDLGYLAAFSGLLQGNNHHPFFVPPVYDLLSPEGFFRKEEIAISQINRQIDDIQTDPHYVQLNENLAQLQEAAEQALYEQKKKCVQAKKERDRMRENGCDAAVEKLLIAESQFLKAETKRIEKYWKSKIDEANAELACFISRIDNWKRERKERSAQLQHKLFSCFRFLNVLGESKNLCDIFQNTPSKMPPAGAGECAAPKLLQYAFEHALTPLAMAEFWWGESPKTEVRCHGYYYPACKGKCRPILDHMLQGLVLEDTVGDQEIPTPHILFEDDAIIVLHKPEGMLSVPGKESSVSVYDWVRSRYPLATGPLIVHRLDMATSGILLVTKSKEAHRSLQLQFEKREIKKRYIALLDGCLEQNEGRIELPLCLDPLDRPRQIVHAGYGKQAITVYKVLSRENGKTRIAFYPITGRTHQLRVHAAHVSGLATPIVGDELYGKKDIRLYLHAECIQFHHPVTGTLMRFEDKVPF